MAHALAWFEVVELARWQPELVAATADLARSAGRPWPIGDDDPPAALARIVARLARTAPGAQSALAAHLIDALELARHNRQQR